jgi:hypothetical protein
MSNVRKFGPRELQSGGEQFLLNRAEWLTIQVYVENALRLPITEAAMRSAVQLLPADSFEPFRAIVEVYAQIYAHCKEWRDETFPESVTLAGDIVSYNRAVPRYYGGLLPHINALIKDPDDAAAMKNVTAILTRLSGEAATRAAHAARVADMVERFAEATEADQKKLGTPGNPGLVDEYRKSHGAQSAEAKELEAKLAEARRLMQEAHDEYVRDTIIAATTPAYLWVPVAGWMIAPVVAGVFTDKALKALRLEERARAEVDRLQGRIAQNVRVMHHIELAQAGILKIKDSMDAALPPIRKIRDTWSTIAADFKDLIGQLEQSREDADLPQTLKAEIELEIDTWAALAKRADEYRTNAYITVAEKAA